MVTIQLTEQDKTDNRWGGMLIARRRTHTTTISGRVSLEYDIVEWTS